VLRGKAAFQAAPTAAANRLQMNNYTCKDYREEMRLIGLKKRLNEGDLSQAEKQIIAAEIAKLEKILKLN